MVAGGGLVRVERQDGGEALSTQRVCQPVFHNKTYHPMGKGSPETLLAVVSGGGGPTFS